MGRGRQPGGREGVVNSEYISCIEIGNNLILKWGAYHTVLNMRTKQCHGEHVQKK